MSIVKEFKEFAMKGNVMDMAIGIIIGAAFGKIVASLVGDVIMPPIGLLLGNVNFTDIVINLKDAYKGADGVDHPAVIMKIGTFIQTFIDFLIIAFVIFMMIKGINGLKKKKEEAPAEPPAPTKEEALLTEIRDLLKK